MVDIPAPVSYFAGVMKQSAIIKPAVVASSALILGAATGLYAGEPAPMPVPAPEPECGNPGWTLTAAALYLKSYGASSESWDGEGYDGDFGWGVRASAGYERPDGLFFRAVGFWYDGDFGFEDNGEFDGDGPSPDGELTVWTGDLLIGDTFCPTANTSFEVSAGVRYGKLETEVTADDDPYSYKSEADFDGWGPTIQVRARRTLTDRIALYADLQQSILFGEMEWKDTETYRGDGVETNEWKSESDTLAAITEIRGGIEFLWGWNAIQNAYLRLGAEGQYWWVDSLDLGLVGGVAEVGFTF